LKNDYLISFKNKERGEERRRKGGRMRMGLDMG